MSSVKSRLDAKHNIRLYGWINFLAGITFLTPIITALYKHTGLSIWEIVLISNIATITVWAFELPTSVVADIFGRKQSLIASVLCNFLSALSVVLFPSFIGFLVASFFSGLYFSFWSGTWQAFLEENLRILGEEHKFGRVIWSLMAYEHFWALITPLFISLFLRYLWDTGYTALALFDVVFAGMLVALTWKLKNSFVREKFTSIFNATMRHYSVAKTAIIRVFRERNLRILMIYRSLANHVAFFPLVFFPLIIDRGMPEYLSGIIVACATVWAMIASKFVYKWGEKHSYNVVWILSTIAQAIILIIIGCIFESSWITLVIAYILFESIESLWQPAWNHVLVEQSRGISVATTRSIIFSIFALYTTIGKQLLSFFPPQHAFVLLGIIMLATNLFLGKKIRDMNSITP